MATVVGQKVAVCAIVRNEASYVEEWVEFHRKQGVSDFIIYDNESTDNTKEVFARCGIQVSNWGYRSKSFDLEQVTAYENARDWMIGKTDWIAYIDVDEFVFGRHGQTLARSLADFDSDVGAIAVQQRIFGSSYHEKRYPGNVIDRFTRCAAPDHLEHNWFKTISRPEMVDVFDSVHSVSLKRGRYVLADGSDMRRQGAGHLHPGHPGAADRIVQGRIGLHHYIVKSREEFLEKSKRWADRTQAAEKRIENYWASRETGANTNVNGELVGFLEKN